jgi:hypothetical protein
MFIMLKHSLNLVLRNVKNYTEELKVQIKEILKYLILNRKAKLLNLFINL